MGYTYKVSWHIQHTQKCLKFICIILYQCFKEKNIVRREKIIGLFMNICTYDNTVRFTGEKKDEKLISLFSLIWEISIANTSISTRRTITNISTSTKHMNQIEKCNTFLCVSRYFAVLNENFKCRPAPFTLSLFIKNYFFFAPKILPY